MVAKVGLGLIGVGAISIGGVAFTKPEWLGINREIKWTSLAEDSDFKGTSTKSGYTGKFGETHKYYLVGATENQDWWKESFEKLKRDSGVSDKFKYSSGQGTNGITQPFSVEESDTALNQICKKAYKSDSTDIDDNGTDTDKYKKTDVWKYCSGLGEKPKSIFETTDDENNYKTNLSDGKSPIGKEDSDRKKLVSTKGNNKFWEIREKEFRNKDGHEKIESADDAFFTSESNKEKSIRDICEVAYGKAPTTNYTSEADKPNKDKVIKYCSLEKK